MDQKTADYYNWRMRDFPAQKFEYRIEKRPEALKKLSTDINFKLFKK